MNSISTIPKIFSAILITFLTLIMIRIVQPISYHILGLFTPGTMMSYAAILSFWLIIVFVTWFLLWARLFEPQVKKLIEKE